MKSKRHKFPKATDVREAVQQEDLIFFQCPSKHFLPHRMGWGRCTPARCVDVPGSAKGRSPAGVAVDEADLVPLGSEQSVLDHRPVDAVSAEETQAKAKATIQLLKRQAIRGAMEAFHEFPEMPEPPKGMKGKEYVDRRMEDITPYVLEDLIFDFKYGAPSDRRAAREQLLDRSGIASKKKDGDSVGRGAVVMIHFGSEQLPFAKRAVSLPKEKYHVEAQQRSEDRVEDAGTSEVSSDDYGNGESDSPDGEGNAGPGRDGSGTDG